MKDETKWVVGRIVAIGLVTIWATASLIMFGIVAYRMHMKYSDSRIEYPPFKAR